MRYLGIRFRLALLALMTVALFALGPWLLPRMIAAIPGPYRQRLPVELLQLIITPLPTALPAPATQAGTADIAIPTIALAVLQEVTHTATVPSAVNVTPPPTLAPSPSASIEAAATTTVTPSPTPTATAIPSPTATPTVEPLPESARVEGLANIPQKFNNCGPTNLSVVLEFYGNPVHQLDIAAILRPNYDDRNVSPAELVRYVREQTPLQATLHSGGDLPLLKRLIASGFPVIIEKGLVPSEREGWMGHYLTVFAYDDAAAEFYSMDTFLGPWDGSGRAASYEAILRDWRHFNYTFLVVYPPERESQVQEILGPTLLDPLAMWQNAAYRARTETETAVDDAFGWFNLGTSLTRLGQLTGQQAFYVNAAVAYDRAREIGLPARMLWYQFDPYVAYLAVGRTDDVLVLANATMIGGGRDVEETHLYRGHALKAQGDEAGATAAYRQALQLNPGFSLAQQALD